MGVCRHRGSTARPARRRPASASQHHHRRRPDALSTSAPTTTETTCGRLKAKPVARTVLAGASAASCSTSTTIRWALPASSRRNHHHRRRPDRCGRGDGRRRRLPCQFKGACDQAGSLASSPMFVYSGTAAFRPAPVNQTTAEDQVALTSPMPGDIFTDHHRPERRRRRRDQCYARTYKRRATRGWGLGGEFAVNPTRRQPAAVPAVVADVARRCRRRPGRARARAIPAACSTAFSPGPSPTPAPVVSLRQSRPHL